jgi:hypothetical protein
MPGASESFGVGHGSSLFTCPRPLQVASAGFPGNSAYLFFHESATPEKVIL